MRGLGELEATIMDAMWTKNGPASVRDVRTLLAVDRTLAYTTVMTVMDNLYRKGLLGRTMVGRAWRYEPLLSRGEYTAQLMRDILASADDHSSALTHFVAAISDEESTALRDLLRRRARGRL